MEHFAPDLIDTAAKRGTTLVTRPIARGGDSHDACDHDHDHDRRRHNSEDGTPHGLTTPDRREQTEFYPEFGTYVHIRKSCFRAERYRAWIDRREVRPPGGRGHHRC